LESIPGLLNVYKFRLREKETTNVRWKGKKGKYERIILACEGDKSSELKLFSKNIKGG
jgi:hypothetical protein